jgi:hypothetical protein
MQKIVNIIGVMDMNNKQRQLKIEKLDKKINELYYKIDTLTKEVQDLENSRKCDICSAVYQRWINGKWGGTDFAEMGLEPVIYNNKKINCVCVSCFYKRWKETNETD